ncbi:ATP synthase subunit C lysine N-methyltransferase isoform X3 [Suricata suricatta]|uniref:ATP synthase subunit C lysine N-methyltransferase isoform X3 n=1 Tax=Suricata suricatta TaxID=37032 RepID=UPI001155BD98|nr:ATP synthase subunit C lysine N-methyltransferase isoform X3 [Suricata suricatta]
MEGGGGEPPEVHEESKSGCGLPAGLGTSGLKKSSWGLLLPGIVGGTLVAVYAVATPFLTPALRKICLPFVPATAKQIENVVKMLHCRRGSLVDIGSGDGRVMPHLEEKLELELKDDARVIACRFPFPRWTPDRVTGEGADTVWAYDLSTLRGRRP